MATVAVASGYKGVIVEGRRFLARLALDGQHTRLGSYETAQEAALVYARAAKASPSLHEAHSLTAAEAEVRRQRKALREAGAWWDWPQGFRFNVKHGFSE